MSNVVYPRLLSRRLGNAMFSLLIVLVVLSGCSKSIITYHSVPLISPITTPHRLPVLFEGWVDPTSSVPRTFTLSALRAYADALRTYVNLNEQGGLFTVSAISEDSFDPQRLIRSIAIDPLPGDPAKPTFFPYPPSTGDPFQDAQNKKQVDAKNAALIADWQQTLRSNHAALDKERVSISDQTTFLETYQPPVVNTGTDECGAFQRISQEFQHASAQTVKIAFLQTDLEDNMGKDCTSGLNLSGAYVYVIFDSEKDQDTNKAEVAYWQHIVRTAGAKDFAVYDQSNPDIVKTLLLSLTCQTPCE